MKESLSLWHLDSKKSAILQKPLKPLKENEVLIKTLYSFVSRGTESLIAKGKVSNSFMDKMGVPNMEGTFELPIKYGYSVVGEIIEGPDKVLGRKVHLMHPHQNLIVTELKSVFLLEDEVDLQKMTMISNMETVVNAYWDADINTTDKVLILGAGNIGVLLAYALRNVWNIECDIVDTDFDIQNLYTGMDIKNEINSTIEYTHVFNTTGSGKAMQSGIDCLGVEGKLIEISWYGDQRVSLNLGDSFHYMRKQIIASQVGLIPLKYQYVYDYKKRKELCLSILMKANFDSLVSGIVDFKNSPELFLKFRKGSKKGVYILRY